MNDQTTRGTSRFFGLFRQWEAAELVASRDESSLSGQLDAFCEGSGRAPGLPEIARARLSRAHAAARLRALNAHVVQLRRRTRVI